MTAAPTTARADAVSPDDRRPVDWRRVEAVVFDLDGTLYDQKKLRRRMAAALLGHVALRPWRLGLLKRINVYRAAREAMGDAEAEDVIARQFAEPAARLGMSAESLALLVAEWIEERPLPHLRPCRFAGVPELFDELRASGRRIVVFSDYAPAAKLNAMGVEADVHVAATDPEVNRLKPHPRGLLRVAELTGVGPEACVFVGDREDRDGACARRVGMPYLIKTARPSSFWQFAEFAELSAALRAADAGAPAGTATPGPASEARPGLAGAAAG